MNCEKGRKREWVDKKNGKIHKKVRNELGEEWGMKVKMKKRSSMNE